MNYSLKISQDRNGAMPKTEKILCWQPPVSDESREDGFSNPRDHWTATAVSIIPGTDDPMGAVARTPRNRMTTPNER
jgi:hypothetical protein